MMSSNSAGKKKRERTVTSKSGTSGDTRYKETIKITPEAAIVEVYADGGYDGPDTLVLRSTDGDSPSARTYHKELAVKNQETEGKLIECTFTLDEHKGTAETKADLEGRRYALGWRPTGEKKSEILLVEDEPYEDVWCAEANRTVMASMTTARFRECAALRFPQEGGDLSVDLPDKLQKEYEPLGTDRPAAFAKPDPGADTPGEPVKSRSSSAGSGNGGAGSGSGGNGTSKSAPVPGARPPETGPPPGGR